MTRKEGFIDVEKMLEQIGVDTTSINSILGSPSVNVIDYMYESKIHFSFQYHGETYYFKRDIYSNCSPYNELVIDELAKDFGISCVDYDLAVLGRTIKGVISKNFRLENVQYISGDQLFTNVWKKYHINTSNNLESIWDTFEYYCYNFPNKREIIAKLTNKIISIYLFDIITAQGDRHELNWEVMEYKNDIDIAPIYDNERILMSNSENINVCLKVGDNIEDYENIAKSIQQFQKVSSSEFTDIIKDKLWIISEENLNKVFDRIEKKTGYPMPDEEKEFYLNGYREHKKKLEEILDLTEVREEPNERKNR